MVWRGSRLFEIPLIRPPRHGIGISAFGDSRRPATGFYVPLNGDFVCDPFMLETRAYTAPSSGIRCGQEISPLF
jgi:hypothetical protein